MYIVKKDEFFKNINSDYGIPAEIQKKLMNGNAQFIMDLAFNLKMYIFFKPSSLKLFLFLEKAILLPQSQSICVISFSTREAI